MSFNGISMRSIIRSNWFLVSLKVSLRSIRRSFCLECLCAPVINSFARMFRCDNFIALFARNFDVLNCLLSLLRILCLLNSLGNEFRAIIHFARFADRFARNGTVFDLDILKFWDPKPKQVMASVAPWVIPQPWNLLNFNARRFASAKEQANDLVTLIGEHRPIKQTTVVFCFLLL